MNLMPMEISLQRMELLSEEIPEITFESDTNGEIWEFIDQPDPSQFSEGLKARLDKHWPEWRKKLGVEDRQA